MESYLDFKNSKKIRNLELVGRSSLKKRIKKASVILDTEAFRTI